MRGFPLLTEILITESDAWVRWMVANSDTFVDKHIPPY